MKILILNGPNLNLQGRRDTDVYGTKTFEEFLEELRTAYADMTLDYFQSNVEGELINALHGSVGVYDGVVFNAGGYTHTSVALRDAISAAAVPTVEVHISNTHKREEFRHVSYTAPVCIAQLQGFGLTGYALAVEGLIAYLTAQK